MHLWTVWIVSNEQLLAWVRNPVPVSQLNDFAGLKCSTPAVDSTLQICNGMPQNEKGVLELCPFPDFPFYTCVSLHHSLIASFGADRQQIIFDHIQYGCPVTTPSPDDPNPAQATSSAQARFRRKDS